MRAQVNLTEISNDSILITGHTGFKGTWLTLLLEKLGFEVFGVSLPPESNSLFHQMGRLGRIDEIMVDVCDREALYKFMKTRKPGLILHLAAQPLVKLAYSKPVSTFQTNVIGTANVLEIARDIPSVKAIGVVTTDKVYKNNNSGKKFRESDELGANEPYSASKVASEATVMAFHSILASQPSYKLLSLRSGNVIGGGDLSDSRIIPDLVRRVYNQEPLTLRNLEATRPWQHVLDPLIGYLRALNYAVENDDYEKSINFGPLEPSLKVQKVVEIFLDETGFSGPLDARKQATLFHESESLELDSSLARKLLDWSPVWDQEEAIRKTARWWSRVYRNQISPLEATCSDITGYLSAATFK